jgi:hypothetical protein
MKAWITGALVTATLTFGGAAHPAKAVARQLAGPVDAATEFSARRRLHRAPRHYRVYAPVYYERPSYYRPYRGLPPFFPFGFGYGLDPSW